MPELPEVEVARRQLARWAEGRTITAVRLPDPTVVHDRWSTRPGEAVDDGADRVCGVVGATAPAPVRHGKRLGWTLGDLGLGVHLGMTGRWLCRESDEIPEHARFGLQLDHGRWLWLEDSRRFGCVVPVPADGLETLLTEDRGPDALHEAPDGPGLAEALSGRGAIKTALMKQEKLAGVGNIQAVEALFRARIAPGRRADDLTDHEWAALAEAIPEQLEATIGFTDGEEVDYVTGGGDNPFAVYDREDEPCPRCGTAIEKGRHSGRATFWCPSCQS